MKIKIAIDGPAASGKSTTARNLAQNLGYLYIDTGAMYRALTLAVLRNNIDIHDEKKIEFIARQSRIELVQKQNGIQTLLNGENVSDAIRSPKINEIISIISAYPKIRKIMVEKQRQLIKAGGIVMDGRDIGTVVLKDAEVKIFMKAELKKRAERRVKEFASKGINLSFEDIKNEIKKRDQIDSSRTESPLKPAPDAHIIDTSDLSIEQQTNKCLLLVQRYLSTGSLILC
ncbi:(d)CMP kinase [Calditrichota bacterium]